MSIRSNSRPVGWDLNPEFQDILRRNGMQAHIIREGEGYKLFVQGHDSPMLSYALDANQIKKLTDWGTNYANKSAYNTLVDLVEKDFYLPRNFVHARNANGRVAMGLHGYRIGVGEYGRVATMGHYPWRHFFGPSFLGWTPRNQDGFHMRRIGPAMFMQRGAPIVPERPDGRMKPGELQNGGYGFYYKGNQNQNVKQEPPKEDVLKELSSVIKPLPPEPRHEGAALPYKEAVTSPVYFSNDKLQQCLLTHGLVINEENKTLTVQSSASEQDFIYDLSDDELKTLTSNSLKESPLENRLALVNEIISNDFREPITMEMLNSTRALSIELKPSVAQDIEYRSQLIKELPIIVPVQTEMKMDAVPYDELIHSKKQFDGQKFETCLATHGIEIDKEANRLIVNSRESDKVHVYPLNAGEVRDLLNDSVKEIPLEKRLDIINSKISFDFHDQVTKETLNSNETLSIRPRIVSESSRENVAQSSEGIAKKQESAKGNATAIPFRYVSSTSEQFTAGRFEQCLESHGISIDSNNSTLTIKSSESNHALTYPLRPDELALLQSDSMKLHSVESRLDLINMISSKDFRDSITVDALNRSEPISIRLKPSVEKQLEYQSQLSAGIYAKPPKDMDKTIEAKPYDELIKSSEKFNGEKFEKCLTSHGIEIDKETNRLIVTSSEANRKYDYHLRPEEVDQLLDDSLEKSPLDRRLDLVNITIAKDFYTPITMDAINSKEPLSIRLRSDVERERGWSAQDGYTKNAITDSASVKYSDGPIPYKELIGSPEKFSGEKFTECLESHGIKLDSVSNTVTVSPANTEKAITYHLRPEEMKILQNDSLTESPLAERLELLNKTIGRELNPQVTMDMLNSKEKRSFTLMNETREENDLEVKASETVAFHMNGNVLAELNNKKAWYREGGDGEQVQVDDILVSKDTEGKYKMTAVINGESITHEISQKQFEKFSAIDEYHRLKLFSKVFDEVDMKTMPGKGVNLLAAVTAGLAVARDLVSGPKYGPAIYEECYNRPHVYFKPGVDSPQDLASRAFEAGVNAGVTGVGLSR